MQWTRTIDLDFLERASSPGEGRFTIDLDRACQLMAGYQLAEPTMYILKLVQWAVASGATTVHVTLSEDEVVVAHDGFPPPDLNLGVLVQAGDGPLLHLSVGVFAALGESARSLTLTAPGYGVTLVGDEPAQPTPDVRLTIRGLPRTSCRVAGPPVATALVPMAYVLSVLWVCFGPWAALPVFGVAGMAGWAQLNKAASTRRDWYWVRFRCVYAPVPVFLNGTPVNRAPFPARLQAVVDAGSLLVDMAQFSLVRDAEYHRVLAEIAALW